MWTPGRASTLRSAKHEAADRAEPIVRGLEEAPNSPRRQQALRQIDNLPLTREGQNTLRAVWNQVARRLAGTKIRLPLRVAQRIGAHPGAGPDLWLDILQKLGGPDDDGVYLIVVGLEGACRYQEVVQELLQSDNSMITRMVLKKGTRHTRPLGFRAYARQQPALALDWLDNHPRKRQQLQPRDLTPLLEHSRTSIRSRAVRWAGSLQKEKS